MTIKPNDIKTGDNLLVSSYSLLARLIHFFQRIWSKKGYEYNHSAMFMWIYGILYVIEADKMGIVPTKYDDYLKSKKKLLLLRPMFPVSGKQYGQFMLNYIGRAKYDFYTLFVVFPVYYITFGFVWIGAKSENGKKFNCGGWSAFVYQNFNEGMFPNPQKISPVDLFNNPNFLHFAIETPNNHNINQTKTIKQ